MATNNNNSGKYSKQLILAVLAGMCFAVPYLFLDFSFFKSFLVGVIFYCAAYLLFPEYIYDDINKKIADKKAASEKAKEAEKAQKEANARNIKQVKKDTDVKLERRKDMTDELYQTIKEAKEINYKIYKMAGEIEDPELVDNIMEIYKYASKIIDEIYNNPSKIRKINNFFDYYLPTTLKLLTSYDTYENQRLNSEESKRFMDRTKNVSENIKISFRNQFNALFQDDLLDSNAELQVFEQMMNSRNSDNNISPKKKNTNLENG